MNVCIHLLGRGTNDLAAAASGLGVLTAHADAPIVAQTAVKAERTDGRAGEQQQAKRNEHGIERGVAPCAPRSVFSLVLFVCSCLPDLLHALEVVAQLGVESVGHHLAVLAVLVVLLVVEEPGRDVELQGLSDDQLDGLQLLLSQLTGALVQVDLSLQQSRETQPPNASTGSKHA